MNKFFIGAFAALSLAACSQEEPATAPTDQNGSAKGEQAFLLVQLAEQDGRSSRAEGDEGEGEETTPTLDGTYQDGYTLGEAKVNSCDFYFYDGNGVYVMTSNILWQDNGQNKPNIELKGKSVVVLDSVQQKGYPKYMVTILNKPAGFTPANTLTEMNTKLVNIANVTKANADAAVRFSGKDKDDKDVDYFTMTTSSYSNSLDYYFVNELSEDDFYKTKEEAMDETGNKPVTVYVERLAAKVSVNLNNLTPVESKTNTYSLCISVAGADNNDSNSDYVADHELYVDINGWSLNAMPKDSYYMKNINTAWTNDGLGFVWNVTDYHRSFWGMSSTYNTNDSIAYTYFNYNNLTNTFWEADEAGKQNAAYTAENTHDATFLNNQTVDNFHAVTTVLLSATIYDPSEANATEKSDMVRYNGVLFTSQRFRDYVIASYDANVYTKDETGYTQASDEYTLVNDGLGNQVYVKFTAKEGVTYYKKDATAEDGYSTIADFTTVNTDLKKIVGEGFKGGRMYYQIPIRHLRALADGETFANHNLKEGQYGVVRNHYYAVNVNKIAKLGTGVWNPDEDIYPKTPKDEELFVLAAQINVLSWRVVTNDVEL